MNTATPANNLPDFIVIGQVTRPHGIRGVLCVHPMTDHPERFKELTRIFLSINENRMPFEIEQVRMADSYLLLTLRDIASREDADRWRNALIEIPRQECLPLSEGQHYFFELLGLTVLDLDGKVIGELSDIIDSPGQDILVITSEQGEHLVPAVSEFIDRIDLEARRIIIKPIPGLLD